MGIKADDARKLMDECIAKGIPMKDVPQITQLIVPRCAVDRQFFAQAFMYEMFKRPMTAQHDAGWKMLEDDTIPKRALCCRRSYGKTSMVVADDVWKVCFRRCKFILFLGHNLDYAATQTDKIKTVILHNKRIRYVFGNMKAKRYEDMDTKDSSRMYFFCEPDTGEPFVCVQPAGVTQHLRGRNVVIKGEGVRPDCINLDDADDDEDVLNGELRKKTRDRFFASINYLVDGWDTPSSKTNRWTIKDGEPPPWQITVTDTLKHEDCLIAHLLADPEWVAVRHPEAEFRDEIHPETGKKVRTLHSLIPEVKSNAKVRAEATMMQNRNLMDVYCREKLCIPMDPESASWTKSSFQYIAGGHIEVSGQPPIHIKSDVRFTRFVIVDPARTSKMTSDASAMLCCAAAPQLNRLVFTEQRSMRRTMSEVANEAFDMAYLNNARAMFVETIGGDDLIRHFFETVNRSKYGGEIALFWLKSTSVARGGDFGTGRDAAKRARASQILPYYETGSVWHDITLKDSILERQMLDYPMNKSWDSLDCAGYVPAALAELGIYFEPMHDLKQSDMPHGGFLDSDDEAELVRMMDSGDWQLVENPFGWN